MIKRTSTAVWRGTGAEGQGVLSTQSGAFKEQPYSAKARFQSEDGKAGTNPEELIGAAHAGCFAMALSFQLSNAGHPPQELSVTATVEMEKREIGWTIENIRLSLTGKVDGIDAAQFKELAEKAKSGCPISRALSTVPVSLEAKLG
jgi:osmotically inducible protein OsmC